MAKYLSVLSIELREEFLVFCREYFESRSKFTYHRAR